MCNIVFMNDDTNTPIPIDLEDDTDIDYDTPALMPDNEPEALERASWHLRCAARLNAETEQLTNVYKTEIERLQIRLEHRRRILADRIAWHETPVRSLHEAILAADPTRKSIELPYGTSKIRVAKTPKVEFTDQAATLAWAEQNRPEIVGHTINVTSVKAIACPIGQDDLVGGEATVFDDNGEIIPGVRATLPDNQWNASYQ